MRASTSSREGSNTLGAPPDTRSGEAVESRLLDVIREAHADLHRRSPGGNRVGLDSALGRELGFDSLARVELLARIEREFGIELPEETLALAETPRDLLTALATAPPARRATVARTRRAAPAASETGRPDAATTLIEALDWHVERHPDRVQIVYCEESGEELEIGYGSLRREAGHLAAGLVALGLKPGQTVAIMLPTSPEYFYCYYGVLVGGGVPVPIYPPARLSQIEEHVRRHAGILANARTRILVTVPEARPVARLLEAHVPGLERIVTPAELAADRAPVPAHAAVEADIAFIQYTSGSTGNPKGVVLTHANLLANIRAIGEAIRVRHDDVFVSWLPLYHDMGLIAAWLSSLYFGCRLVVMSPLAFLARPERWLWAIHRHRGTLAAAPNFAYELCVKRIDDAALEGLDLSSWRLAANGAEPVVPETMERFIERFARYGFARGTLTAVYGLAECTVGVLCPVPGRGPLIDRVEREAFVREGRAVPARDDDPHPLRFAACGPPLPGHEVRIADARGEPVGERIEGTLWFRGPSATSGYYRNPEETAKLVRGEWLDSGDRAYLAGGDIYLTGRVKDIIIRGGRNIYPHEVEDAVGSQPGIRRGCVAVFGSPDPKSGTERLVVLAETRVSGEAERTALRDAVNRVVADVLGEPADEIVLAPPHTVLKTSSGKLRRAATRELFEAGLVGRRLHAAWWQVARLVSSAALGPLARAIDGLRGFAHALRVWLAFALLAPATWIAVALQGNPDKAWTLAHHAARLFFRLAGIPVALRHAERVPEEGGWVMVANHASFLDGVFLIAALRRPHVFVAKAELRGHFVSRVFLTRIGTAFVDRFDIRQSAADVERMAAFARSGRPVCFFPEGTFGRLPGLLPFRLGAFSTAVSAEVSVVPVAIRGARTVLREGTWFPGRGGVELTVAELSHPPQGEDGFTAAVALRDAARTHILAHCGEPDAGGTPRDAREV